MTHNVDPTEVIDDYIATYKRWRNGKLATLATLPAKRRRLDDEGSVASVKSTTSQRSAKPTPPLAPRAARKIKVFTSDVSQGKVCGAHKKGNVHWLHVGKRTYNT